MSGDRPPEEKSNTSDTEELGPFALMFQQYYSERRSDVDPPVIAEALTELHQAIAEKSLKKVNALIRGGVDVNGFHPQDEFGFPLSRAIDAQDLRIIRSLLKAGADPNVEDSLARSIKQNSLSLAKALIEHGANLDGQPTWEKDNDFETNLIRATRLGLYPFVKLLLEAGANPNRHDGNDQSALFLARKNKNKRLIKLLEQYVSDEELAWVEERYSAAYAERLRLDKEIYEAIHAAEPAIALELLQSSKKPLDELLEPEWGTPLEEALAAYYRARKSTRPKLTVQEMIDGKKQGKPDCTDDRVLRTRQLVESLIDLGAPVDKGGWRTPISTVAWIEDDDPHVDLSSKLISHLADIDMSITPGGETLLMLVSAARNETFAKIALERGADFNARDRSGESVLQKARSSEEYDGPNPCVPLLLAAGAKE